MNTEVIDRIFTVNLGVKKSEETLVFTDIAPTGAPDAEKRSALVSVARAAAEEGRKFCTTRYVEFPATGGHGTEPPPEVWTAAFGQKAVEELDNAGLLENIIAKLAGPKDLKKAEEIITKHAKSPDTVIALSHHSTSHTRFRDYLTRCMDVRYASMPMFDSRMLDGVMTADWNAVKARTMNLVEMMTGGDDIVITSHNGTSILFSMKGRDVQPDTGIITEPGSFSNLPAGEAFLAPVEGTAEGTLILEWAPDRKLDRPITLDIKDGFVVNIDGRDKFAEVLRRKISENHLCGNIAELGIGTNDRAERPDNILETEKILGTVHIALGDNSSFGGKVSVPFHQDFIFFKPTMEVLKGEERVEILIDGEPRF